MKQIRKSLQKKGLTLSAEFQPKFGVGWSASEEWQKQIDWIAEIIQQKQNQKCTASWKDHALTSVNPLAKLLIPSEDKKFTVDEKCTGCGTCEKICPVKISGSPMESRFGCTPVSSVPHASAGARQKPSPEQISLQERASGMLILPWNRC